MVFCKALFMLLYVKATGYFCYFNNILSSDNHFSFVFSSSSIIQMRLAKQNRIFQRQLTGWFDVKGTYLFESVGLLFISIQIFVPVLFIMIFKNGKLVMLLSIVNCNSRFTWFKIVSKSLGSINLIFSKISWSYETRNQL